MAHYSSIYINDNIDKLRIACRHKAVPVIPALIDGLCIRECLPQQCAVESTDHRLDDPRLQLLLLAILLHKPNYQSCKPTIGIKSIIFELHKNNSVICHQLNA